MPLLRVLEAVELFKLVPRRPAECYRSPYYRRFSEMSALKTRLSKADCRYTSQEQA
jgi:hypothetical protein